MATDTKTADPKILKQEWELVVEKGGGLILAGQVMLDRLVRWDLFEDAELFLFDSRVGDVVKTGVSAYRRIA